MKKIYSYIFCTVFLFTAHQNLFSQIAETLNQGQISGNFESNTQYYNPDTAIGAPPVPEKMLMNGFANINYTNNNFSAGMRYESYLNVLQGFPAGYKGNGIMYRYASFKAKELEVTVGSFYDQFGNGLIFRSYEERGLGWDNAMDGVRVKYHPHKGIQLKGLVGKQRNFFTYGVGIVRGFDGEVNMNELFFSNDSIPRKGNLIIGGSFVSRYQPDQNSSYVLPENVGASAGRINFTYGGFSIGGEYAYKINDPNADNNFIYKPGEAILVQTSYVQKGMSISFNAKRQENMGYRSDITANGTSLYMNFLPALCRQHTYALMAFYPYAVQPNGEMAFQGEFNYKVKKETLLGGKYGMDISLTYAQANGLDTTNLNPLQDSSRMGYKSNYFGLGDVYYRDFVFEVSKKFSKKIKTTLMYAYQEYNKDVVQSIRGYGTIYSHIGLADITYKFQSDKALRMELQHLYTKDDMGSWAHGLVELTLGSQWFVALQDQYNYGNEKSDKRFHYYNATVGYVKNANRIVLGYGRQRSGIFCVGGVCRLVPASNGVSLTITSSF